MPSDPYSSIRYRAKKTLADRHVGEYQALLNQMRDDPRRCDKARNELARRHSDEYRALLTDEHTRQALQEEAD